MEYNVVISYRHGQKIDYPLEIRKQFAAYNYNHDNIIRFNLYYSDLNPTGIEWDPVIRKEFEKADIYVCLLSDNYYESEYIREVELPLMLARNEKNSEILIECVYIDNIVKQHVLSKFQSLNINTPLSHLSLNEAKDQIIKLIEHLAKKCTEKNRRSHALQLPTVTNHFYPKTGFFFTMLHALQSINSRYKKYVPDTSGIENLIDQNLKIVPVDIHKNVSEDMRFINFFGIPGVGKSFFLYQHVYKLKKHYSKHPLIYLQLDKYLLKKDILITPETIWNSLVEEIRKLYSINLSYNQIRHLLKTRFVIITLQDVQIIENFNPVQDIYDAFKILFNQELRISQNNKLYIFTTTRKDSNLIGYSKLELTALSPIEANTGKKNVLDFYYELLAKDKHQIFLDYNKLDFRKHENIKKIFNSESTRTPLFIVLSKILDDEKGEESESKKNNNPLDIFNYDLPSLIENYFSYLIQKSNAGNQFSLIDQILQVISKDFIESQNISASVYTDPKNVDLRNNLAFLNALGLIAFNQRTSSYNFQHSLFKEYFFIKWCFVNKKYEEIEVKNMADNCREFILHFLIEKDDSHKILSDFICRSFESESAQSVYLFSKIVNPEQLESFFSKFSERRLRAENTVYQSLLKVLDFKKTANLRDEEIDIVVNFLRSDIFRSRAFLDVEKRLQSSSSINLIRVCYRLNDTVLNKLIEQNVKDNYKIYLKYWRFMTPFFKEWILINIKKGGQFSIELLEYLFKDTKTFIPLINYVGERFTFKDVFIINSILKSSSDKPLFRDAFRFINLLIRNASNDEKYLIMNHIAKQTISNMSHVFFIPEGKLNDSTGNEYTVKTPLTIDLIPRKVKLIHERIKVEALKTKYYILQDEFNSKIISENLLDLLFDIKTFTIHSEIKFHLEKLIPGIKHIYLLLQNESANMTYKYLLPSNNTSVNTNKRQIGELNNLRGIDNIEFNPSNPLLYLRCQEIDPLK